jgi:hypothetical protein
VSRWLALARRLAAVEAFVPSDPGMIVLGKGMSGLRAALERVRESDGSITADRPPATWAVALHEAMAERKARRAADADDPEPIFAHSNDANPGAGAGANPSAGAGAGAP